MTYNKIITLAENFGCEYVIDALMKDYNTMKVGGKADLLIKVNSVDSIKTIIKEAKKENINYYVIGNGSNILVTDEGLKGIVLVFSDDFSNVECHDGIIKCDAGASLSKVCTTAYNNSLTGFEFAWGIPGSVGGAVYMNAGAYGGEISQIITACDYLDTDGIIKSYSSAEMDLSYRHSVFTDSDMIILSVQFKLQQGDKAEIKALMNKNLDARKSKQPLEYPSSGSTFKRPVGSYASMLIEQSGLKGYYVGGAQVSEKHAGFVINKGNATFSDIMQLIDDVKKTVCDKTGFVIEEEVKILR